MRHSDKHGNVHYTMHAILHNVLHNMLHWLHMPVLQNRKGGRRNGEMDASSCCRFAQHVCHQEAKGKWAMQQPKQSLQKCMHACKGLHCHAVSGCSTGRENGKLRRGFELNASPLPRTRDRPLGNRMGQCGAIVLRVCSEWVCNVSGWSLVHVSCAGKEKGLVPKGGLVPQGKRRRGDDGHDGAANLVVGGGAEREDPCKGAERTMLMMRCRRGARSRGSIRVPDRSVMAGVESVLARAAEDGFLDNRVPTRPSAAAGRLTLNT